MARFNPQILPMGSNPNFANFWVWGLILLMCGAIVGLIVVTMTGKGTPRSKSVKRKAGDGPSNTPRDKSPMEEEASEEEGAVHTGRRTRDQIEKDREEKWVRNMPGRTFKNERQVDLDSLGTDFPGMRAITKRGMGFWFTELSPFRIHAVVEFYTNMVVHFGGVGNKKDDRIESRVGKKTIVVTADTIAKYLGYRRPQEYAGYPGNFIPTEMLVEDLYENKNDYNQVFRAGYFKEDYRLLNKVLQYNLFPRVSGKRVNIDFAHLLYYFKHVETHLNCALWIFDQLVDFRTKSTASSNIPFPCMISQLCFVGGVRWRKKKRWRKRKKKRRRKRSHSFRNRTSEEEDDFHL